MSSRPVVRVVAASGAIAVAATLATATTGSATAITGSAAAEPASSIRLNYDAVGSTTLANPNSKAVVNFKPAVLESKVILGDKAPYRVVANLPLAPVRSSYKAYGFLPSSGTVVFTQVKPVKGELGDLSVQPFRLSATATYVVSLRDVKIGGVDARVGPNCQTIRPVVATVQDEGDFNLSSGTLSGTYTLPKFQNCGRAEDIINDTLPGDGNTLTLKISNGSAPQAVAQLKARARAAS